MNPKIHLFPNHAHDGETASQRDARLGRMHLDRGEWNRSVSYLTAALVFEPHDGTYWRDLGLALAGLGDTGLARDAWRAALTCSWQCGDASLGTELQRLLDTLPGGLS